MTERFLCFGELLLRLAAPGREPLLHSRKFDVHVGGAEANVAVSLARLGNTAEFISTVADNALGEAAIGELRRHGVDTRRVRRGNGRMGLYFLAVGAGHRASEVLYDRADSAFVRTPQPEQSWDELLADVTCLHVSGITPALGDACATTALAAMQAARRLGVFTVFDGNYRARLWRAGSGDAATIIRSLMAEADLILGDHRDIAVALDWQVPDDEQPKQILAAAERAFDVFSNLSVLASTIRDQHSVDHHSLGAVLIRRGEALLHAGPFDLSAIVDRIGAGDAFAAGLLHALRSGRSDHQALRYGLAAACLKHTVPGDFNLVDDQTIADLVDQGRFDVRR